MSMSLSVLENSYNNAHSTLHEYDTIYLKNYETIAYTSVWPRMKNFIYLFLCDSTAIGGIGVLFF